jgi:glycine oxidase
VSCRPLDLIRVMPAWEVKGFQVAHTADVVIVGGGLIGLGIAWRAAERGLKVTVLDPTPGAGASGVAAGMLAPVSELHYGERALLQLNLASARLFGDWAAQLHERTGVDIGYRTCGTVVIGWDRADLAALRDLHAFQRELGLDAELLNSRELRQLEPDTAPGLPGGLLVPGDHQVDPRLLHTALLEAGAAAGVRLIRQRATSAVVTADQVSGVMLDNAELVGCDQLLLAGGAWIGELAGLPAEVRVPVRPVKGQTLQLRAQTPGLITRVIRGTVRGSPVYLVPRDDGRLVVGASSEEAGFDVRPRAGAVYELLRDAQALVPQVSELELEQVATSLRPGSPDNAPIIGRTELTGLAVAGGHFRNGVLLTPITAHGVAQLLAEGAVPDELLPFSPQRFTRPGPTVPGDSRPTTTRTTIEE